MNFEKLLETKEAIKETSSTSTIKSINAKELLSMKIEAPHTVVDNMICQGVTIYAGAPKVA